MADSNNMLPAWSCNICFEESQNPVCTSCGHLFCWPCLYPWVHDMAKPCPVCRSSLTVHASIIPVYVSTQAEPPQAANAAAAIPPRPHPRAPTPSAHDHDSNAVHLPYREPVGDRDSNVVQLYRETVGLVRRQEVLERARLAEEEEGIGQMQNLIGANARRLACLRRELKELRRRNRALVVSSAGSGTGQASTRNSLGHGVMDSDRADGTEAIRRVLNAILGRLQ